MGCSLWLPAAPPPPANTSGPGSTACACIAQTPTHQPPPTYPLHHPTQLAHNSHRFARDFDPEVQAGGKEGQQKMRDLCERALTAGGLHVTGGLFRAGEGGVYQELGVPEGKRMAAGSVLQPSAAPLCSLPRCHSHPPPAPTTH